VEELDVFKLYQDILIPLTPHPSVSKLLEAVMSGGESTDDVASIVALDPELQHWIRLTVQRLGFERQASKINQAVILLGQNRIRDFVIGRHIERKFISPENTIMGKLAAESAKSKKDAPAAIKGEQKSTEEEAAESIPQVQDFQVYLEFAIQAEEVAISIRNSYPGQAYAGGIIFDYVQHFLTSRKIQGLTDSRLKNVKTFIEETFKDGIRNGIAANEIMQKISIPHQKNVFVTAMVHNIGKAMLMAYDPINFEKSFKMSSGATEKDSKTKRIRSEDAEAEVFDFDHAQAGSLYIGRLPFLAEIERSIDYHHQPHLLRFSNPKLYALACVMSVSGGISKLYQKSRAQDPDIDKIRDQRLTASEDFKYLKLNEEDWKEIKSNYALKLMKVGY
jgi:HD-like signal output (HDOD) protein